MQNISIYFNDQKLYFNETLGLLVNYSTQNNTQTNSSGNYNYTFTVSESAGNYTFEINITYNGFSTSERVFGSCKTFLLFSLKLPQTPFA